MKKGRLPRLADRQIPPPPRRKPVRRGPVVVKPNAAARLVLRSAARDVHRLRKLREEITHAIAVLQGDLAHADAELEIALENVAKAREHFLAASQLEK